ncbi:hypothetical protein AVDCRST_MAG82-936, partial [uncultured Rubrobacteraceae bacterium]
CPLPSALVLPTSVTSRARTATGPRSRNNASPCRRSRPFLTTWRLGRSTLG